MGFLDYRAVLLHEGLILVDVTRVGGRAGEGGKKGGHGGDVCEICRGDEDYGEWVQGVFGIGDLHRGIKCYLAGRLLRADTPKLTPALVFMVPARMVMGLPGRSRSTAGT